MKVVLLKSKKHLGNIGDVIEVKDGFGRNFLIPQSIATRATKENLAEFEAKKHDLEERHKKLHKEALELAEKINGKDFVFITQSSDDGKLFGSVSSKDIAQLISSISNSIHHSNIVLEAPLKILGVFEVNVHLYVGVDAKILVNIARSQTEAGEAIKAYKAAHAEPTPAEENKEEAA